MLQNLSAPGTKVVAIAPPSQTRPAKDGTSTRSQVGRPEGEDGDGEKSPAAQRHQGAGDWVNNVRHLKPRMVGSLFVASIELRISCSSPSSGWNLCIHLLTTLDAGWYMRYQSNEKHEKVRHRVFLSAASMRSLRSTRALERW